MGPQTPIIPPWGTVCYHGASSAFDAKLESVRAKLQGQLDSTKTQLEQVRAELTATTKELKATTIELAELKEEHSHAASALEV